MSCSGHAVSSIVELNVGGHRHTTSLQTLRRDPNSMLAAMFAERDGKSSVGLARDSVGAIFIDYDGSSFGELLNFLRNDGSFIAPHDPISRERLQRAACYFQVLGLIQHLTREKEVPSSDEMSFAKQVVSSSARGVQATAIRTLATIGAFGFRFVIFGLVLPTKEENHGPTQADEII